MARIAEAVTTPALQIGVEDFIRIRASTDEGQSTIVEWQGQVLSYKAGDVPAVVFNVQGINIARAKKVSDGSYDLLGRELQLYLDPVTNEVLRVWHNPYSGKEVPVVHVANNPVQQKIPQGAAYQARAQPGGTYTFSVNIPLAYPNPLNPSADPKSPLYPYSGPQARYSAIESFTFTFPASELSGPTNSVPSTQVYWTRTSPLLPFMATPATDVSLLFVASGAKVDGGWENIASAAVRRVIEERLPVYKDAPTERDGPGGGVSSWSYFARPEVFQAYLNGATFPLPDPA